MKMSVSPWFHAAVMVLLRARVHHSSRSEEIQILHHANQNRQGKEGCFMTELASARSEDVAIACTQIEKLMFSNIP